MTRLTNALETEKATVTTLRTQLAIAQNTANTATQQAQQQAQGQEANQRAQNLKTAFPAGQTPEDALVPIAATASPAKMATTRGRLTLTRGAYRTATLSGNGLRSATMALTRGTDSGQDGRVYGPRIEPLASNTLRQRQK